jgi:predicted nucleotidyltransferase
VTQYRAFQGEKEIIGEIMKTSLEFLNETEKNVVTTFVKELKKKVGDDIVAIRLFGSKARGDFEKDSDIDIFVLVKQKGETRDRISDIAADYFYEYNVPIAPVVYSVFEYEKNKELGSFFFEQVEREGVPL